MRATSIACSLTIRAAPDDLLLLDGRRLERLLPVDLGGLHDLVLVDLGGLLALLRGDLRLALGALLGREGDGDGLLLLDAGGLDRLLLLVGGQVAGLLLDVDGLGRLGALLGGVLADLARLVGLGLLLLLLQLQLPHARLDVLGLDLVVLLALDLVGLLAVGLDRLGDGAQALGVEDVVLVELLDGDHREAGDGHVLQREAVLLELLGEGGLDVLGELLALAVQRHERLHGGHRAQRVGELALDEGADGVLVEVAVAERARRGEYVLGQGLHLDVELGRDVGLDLVAGDERVLARSAPRAASPSAATRAGAGG